MDDQDPSFGVYAVPGLKSHVFVGPFAAPKTDESGDDDDIVCLEDEEEEVKVIEPNKEAVKEEDKAKKQELSNTRKAISQIPQVIDKAVEDDDCM